MDDIRHRLNQLEVAWSRFEEETRAQVQAILSSSVDEAEEISEQILQVVYALDGLWTEAAPNDQLPELVVFMEKVIDAARGFRDEAAALPRSITHLAELGQNPDPGEAELAAMEQAVEDIADRLESLKAEREQFGTMAAQLLAIPASDRSDILGQVSVKLRPPVRVQHILRAFTRERRRRYEEKIDEAVLAVDRRRYDEAKEKVAEAVVIIPDTDLDGEPAAPMDLRRYKMRRRVLDLCTDVTRLGPVTLGIIVTVTVASLAMGANHFRGELIAKNPLKTQLSPSATSGICEEHPAGWRFDCATREGGKCGTRCVRDGLRVGVSSNSGKLCWARMEQLTWRVAGDHQDATDRMNQACLRTQGKQRYQKLLREVKKYTRGRQWEACLELVKKALALPGISNKSELEAAQRKCLNEKKGRKCTFLAQKMLQSGELDKAAPEILKLKQCGGQGWQQEQRKLLKQLYWRRTLSYLEAIQGAPNKRPLFDEVVKFEQATNARLKTRPGQGARAAELKHPEVIKRIHPSRMVFVPLEVTIGAGESAPPRRVVVSFNACAAPDCEHRRARPQRHDVAWCLATGLERYVLCAPLPISVRGWKRP